MAESWFDAYDNVGGAARFDTAAIPAAGTSSPAASGQGFMATNGGTLVKVAAALGCAVLVWSLQHRGPAAATKVVTVPAVTVAPAPVATPVAVMVPQLAPAVTVAPDAPTPTPVLAVPSGGFGDLMENVCGNASTGYRMCRGSKRNAAQVAANWP